MNRKAGTTPSPEAAPLALDLPLEAAAPVTATLQMEVIPGVTTHKAAMELARHMPIASRPPSVTAATPGTPMALLEIAMNQGADLDRLERLMAMQERWEANEARKAFVVALAAFKADPPELHKNKQVKFTTGKGTTEYKHATLDEVALQIGAAMAPHGLSFRWNVEQAPGQVRVTCTLTHILGHSEAVTMVGAADDSGSKNPIQAVGSTVTYLQRYTLLAASGMAVKDQDNDGAGVLSFEVEENCQRIAEAKTLQELEATFREVYKKAMATKNLRAVGEYIKAKDARKGELR